jgi:hypothetical protein
MLFDGLDDFIAMARFLAQQPQNDQLQVARCEHLCGAHARTAAEATAERATEEPASAAAAKVRIAASATAKSIELSKHSYLTSVSKYIS